MAYSKARRLSDLISATGEVASYADASIVPADLHSTLDLTGKTITVANTSTGDSDTTVANTAFVQQEIAALVASAPGTLNTLNELAAALGDDASFSTTVTDSIATKLPLAGGTMTGTTAHGDGVASTFGNSADLTISHAGGSTYLTNTTGSLVLRSDSFRVLNTANSEQILHGTANGAVVAYYDNAVKLATTNTGIAVTGGATFSNATVHYGNGAAPIDWGDTSTVGQLSFSGSTAIIRSSVSDGDMILQGNDNGSFISALTLDMSAAGTATFNAGILATSLDITSTTPKITFVESDVSKQYEIGSFGGAFAIRDSTAGQYRYILDTNGNHIFNEGSQDCDFRVESNGNANMLFVDGGNDRVGVGRAPTISNSKLEVGGADNVPLINVEASGNTGGIGIGSTGLQFFHGTSKKMTINSNYVIPKMNFNFSGANTGAQSTTGDENNSASGVQMFKQQITVAAGSRVIVWVDSGQIGAFSFGSHNPQMAVYIDSNGTSPSRGASHRINKDNNHHWYPMSTANSRLFMTAIGGKTISTAGTYYIYVYGGAYNGGSFHFNYQGATRGCSIIWAEVQG